jgi:peroxiredoxin
MRFVPIPSSRLRSCLQLIHSIRSSSVFQLVFHETSDADGDVLGLFRVEPFSRLSLLFRTRARVRLSSMRALIIGVTALLGLAAFYVYVSGVRDGLTWRRGLVMRTISPDFVETDLAHAKKIPEFALADRFGRKVSLHQFASVDLLLVNIWSSSCPVCRDEVPELTEMDRRLASLGRVALLTIAVEKSFSDVVNYFPQGTDLRILFDSENAVAKGLFGTERYPETFVLDRERRVLARFDGRRPWHSEAMFEYLKSYLPER